MIDRDEVIKGLRCCKPSFFTVANCVDDLCPYNCYGHEAEGCVDHLIEDAILLLEEHDPASSNQTDRR